MGIKLKTENIKSKLLDFWKRPADAGDPVGCVATTFTFDHNLFDQECLSRFMDMESDSIDDDLAYRIELEEKLINLKYAGVLVDKQHARGAKTIRWDIIPIKIKNGCMNAKISVLHWQNIVRIIVASANITNSGYRENREIFAIIDYFQGSANPRDVGITLLDFVDEIARSSKNFNKESVSYYKLNVFLEETKKKINLFELVEGPRDYGFIPILSGPDREDVLSQIKDNWSDLKTPNEIEITSPFFDDDNRENGPSKKIWRLLKQRGYANLTYFIRSFAREDGEFEILAPEYLKDEYPKTRPDTSVSFHSINHYNDDPDANRQLHAKTIYIESDNRCTYLVGSSNFTSPGLGIGQYKNIEANIMYYCRIDKNIGYGDWLQKASIDGEKIFHDEGTVWQNSPEDPEDTIIGDVLIEDILSEVVYTQEDERPRLILRFTETEVRDWTIYINENQVLLDYKKWAKDGRKLEYVISWGSDQVPGEIIIKTSGGEELWYPVIPRTNNDLPVSEDFKNLTIDNLIQIYTSNRPLYKILSRMLKKRWKKSKSNGDKHAYEVIDPHRNVNTSGYLLQRTRRLSSLFSLLRKRLEKPCVSHENLKWRLNGPIGIHAVVKAIDKEKKTKEELNFFVAELVLELLQVSPTHEERCLSIKQVKREVLESIQKLADDYLSDTGEGMLENYIDDIKEELGKYEL